MSKREPKLYLEDIKDSITKIECYIKVETIYLLVIKNKHKLFKL